MKHLLFSLMLISSVAAAKPAPSHAQNPMYFNTTHPITQDVACAVNEDCQIEVFQPGWNWSNFPGYAHMGEYVTATVQLENTSSEDATGVWFFLGNHNAVAGPFTVKAGQDLFVSGIASDSFTPPTHFADYSLYVWVDPSSPVGVTAKNAGTGSTATAFNLPF